METQEKKKPVVTVPLKTRIAWGFGGLADNYMFNVYNVLFLYVYVNYFNMDPVLAGIATAIPRFFDAITDPMVGNWSDNFRSKWGRRRPLIVLGTLCCAFLLPFYWMPPFLSSVKNVWYNNGPFLFVSILGCIYALAYTLFVVPYTALGFELTDDYDEKTRVLAWRMYLGLAGQCIVPWIYKISVNKDLFDNIQQGAIVVTIVMSLVIIVCGFLPAIFCKEKMEHSQATEKLNLWVATKATFGNKPFLIVILGFFIVLSGSLAVGSIGGFLNLYLVCKGNESMNGNLAGWTLTVMSLVSYISMFMLAFVSRLKGKREAFMLGMVITTIGQVSLWFTIDPRWPYLQLVSLGFWALAMQGCWLMLDSMLSDICDDDERETGHRREGMFGAVRGFIQKASQALMAMISGFILKFTGFDAEVAKAGGLDPSVAMRMKLLYVLIPATGFLLGLVVFYFYPISRERAAETRRILDERNAKTKA